MNLQLQDDGVSNAFSKRKVSFLKAFLKRGGGKSWVEGVQMRIKKGALSMEFTLADLRVPYMNLRSSFANNLTFSLFLFTFLIISYRSWVFFAIYITKQEMHDRVITNKVSASISKIRHSYKI